MKKILFFFFIFLNCFGCEKDILNFDLLSISPNILSLKNNKLDRLHKKYCKKKFDNLGALEQTLNEWEKQYCEKNDLKRKCSGYNLFMNIQLTDKSPNKKRIVLCSEDGEVMAVAYYSERKKELNVDSIMVNPLAPKYTGLTILYHLIQVSYKNPRLNGKINLVSVEESTPFYAKYLKYDFVKDVFYTSEEDAKELFAP